MNRTVPPHRALIAAAHRPLESLVESDQLVKELYFALTPLTILLPPLRMRLEDLELLSQYFLEELNRGDARQVNGFHEDVWWRFRRYTWPGNVRELRRLSPRRGSPAMGR